MAKAPTSGGGGYRKNPSARRSKRTAQGTSKNTRFTNKHKKRRAGRVSYRGQGR